MCCNFSRRTRLGATMGSTTSKSCPCKWIALQRVRCEVTGMSDRLQNAIACWYLRKGMPAIDGTMKGTGPQAKRFSEDRTSPYCNLARLLPWLTELPPDGVQVCDQSVQWRLVAASRDSSAWVHLGEKHRAHDQHYGHMMAWRWEVAGTRGAARDGQVRPRFEGS